MAIPNPNYPMMPWKFIWGDKTFIMGIMNLSLDSFSEPGVNEFSKICEKIKKMEIRFDHPVWFTC